MTPSDESISLKQYLGDILHLHIENIDNRIVHERELRKTEEQSKAHQLDLQTAE